VTAQSGQTAKGQHGGQNSVTKLGADRRRVDATGKAKVASDAGAELSPRGVLLSEREERLNVEARALEDLVSVSWRESSSVQ